MGLSPDQIQSDNVAEINRLVGRLREVPPATFVPYVHPSMGGTRAPVLSVLESPGPKTKETDSLGLDNPDPTSTKQKLLMAQVGITRTDLCPWNAVPWMVRSRSNAQRIAQGALVLTEVIALMSHLRVLFLQGYQARLAWEIVRAFRPGDFDPGAFEVVATHHPNWEPADPRQAALIDQERLVAWREVASIIRRP